MSDPIVVTGANGGLGRSLGVVLRERGSRVIAIRRQPPDRPSEGDLIADLSTERGFQLLRTSEVSSIGGMFLCAATYADPALPKAASVGPLSELQLAAVNTVVRNTLFSTLTPLMAWSSRVVSGSSIVVVSSSAASMTSGVRDYPRYAYGMAKAAVNRLVVEAAQELKGRGVTVCAVDPGWFNSEMGGIEAPAEAAQVAEQLVELRDRLDLSHTGRYLRIDGQVLPW